MKERETPRDDWKALTHSPPFLAMEIVIVDVHVCDVNANVEMLKTSVLIICENASSLPRSHKDSY